MRDETTQQVLSKIATYAVVCGVFAYLLPDHSTVDHVVHVTLWTCALGEAGVGGLFLVAMLVHRGLRDHLAVGHYERDFGVQLAPHIDELLDRQQRGQPVQQIHHWLVESINYKGTPELLRCVLLHARHRP